MNARHAAASAWIAIAAVSALLASSRAWAASGGPDGEGYTWADSAEPGVVYAWEDISATGVDLVTANEDDFNFGFQALSFPFPYYSGSYSQVACTTNGWASFVDDVSTAYNNVALPAAGSPTGALAAWWDDLEVELGVSHVWFQDFGTRAVITWSDVYQLNQPADVYTFQMILYPDGRIAMQYRDMVGQTTDGTIGIESPDEVNGLTPVSDDFAGIPTTGYRVEFIPPTPVINALDCSAAVSVACGARVPGDNRTGAANQAAYRCSSNDYSGREIVYQVDIPVPASVLFTLTSLGGDQDMVIVRACDANLCAALPGDSVILTNQSGTFFVVVDSAPGQEGPFDLEIDCLTEDLAFCGSGLLETDAWDNGNGAWLVNGWLYHPFDTHSFALRVDGATTYDHDGGSCTEFPGFSTGVRGLTGPAFVQWDAPEGSIREEFSEVTSGACCGLLVAMTITNTDSVPHSYEFRTYHDTAFGDGVVGGACNNPAGRIDGGPIECNGVRYDTIEQDLLAIGADTCQGQVQMFSGDFPTELRASYQMLPPNTPIVMEWDRWNNGGSPCTTWSGFVNGESLAGCTDNSLLLIWRFPQGSGTLAPGESAQAAYRIGYRCAFPCAVICESPTMTTATAQDIGPCNDGIGLAWAAAMFPGTGSGVYHVYRSTISAADALARPPISGGGVSGTTYTDATTVPGELYYYVIQAEALDFPNCGIGPLVNGTTIEIEPTPQPISDVGDTDPPSINVGSALRALGHGTDTVNFLWPTAPMPGPGEHYAILRSNDDPQGPFVLQATTPLQAWTDPAAPPRYSPVHVWFYDVRIADDCGNVSLD